MKRLRHTLLALACALSFSFAHSQVTITVDEIPSYYTPLLDTLYIAGTFNNWNPGDPTHILQPNGNGGYSATITAPVNSNVEYKFTRGDWNRVETQADGSFLPNRSFTYTGSASINDSIRNWDDFSGPHTAVGNTHILDLDFPLPQYNTIRRIWVYLPQDYYTSAQTYPVIYMHDGQNLFDVAYTAFGTEWEVDESMEDIQNNQGVPGIVVGVDNGGLSRINEYTPYANPQYGGGGGEAYIDFIVNTLKPYIDANFRSRPQREYTAIAGSSLGGLISFYAAIERPDIFSKAGIFSPSFWYNDSSYTHVAMQGHSFPMRIYMLAGDQESATMVPNMYRMRDTLLANGFSQSELFVVNHSDGQHSEWYWAREYPACYNWLFQNTVLEADVPQVAKWALRSGPEGRFVVRGPVSGEIALRISNLKGQVVYENAVGNGQVIQLPHLPAGMLVAHFGQDADSIFQKILKR